jgi:PB1 domain
MEYRKEPGQRMTASQGTLPPTSSTSTGLNVPVPGPTRPVLNYSIQTGEEFALEFMRDRAMSKMPSAPLPVAAPAPSQMPVQPQTGYMDLRGILGVCHTGSEASSDISTLAASIEKPNPNPPEVTENKPYFSSTRSAPAPSPPRAMSGYTSSEAASDTSGSKRVKFLCSYGGKVLPRPSDGKLRYVGGETHIVRINCNISFQELKRKTTAIYNLPHAIKYQLPGEDLDALISVSNNEDLRNMMEECGVLLDGSSDRGRGSQKLRIFLFSSIDFDDSSLSLGSMDGDSEVQFLVAINGMDTGLGTGKPVSGYGWTSSTQGGDFDQFMHLSLNMDGQKTNGGGTGTSTISAGQNQTQGQVQAQPSLSSEFKRSLYSSHSERVQHTDPIRTYPSVNPSENLYQYNTASLDSTTLSGLSDYGYISQYTPQTATGITSVVPPGPPHISRQVVHEREVVLPKDTMIYSTPSLPVQTPALVKDDPSSLIPTKDTNTKHVETAPVPILKQSDSNNNEVNNEEARYSSGGAFNSGYSDHDTDVVDHIQGKNQPKQVRVFHSERIPREQAESMNRLSKSNDSLGSQFFIINTSRSDAVRDSIAEVVDPTLEVTSTSSHPLGGEPTHEEDLLKFRNYENTPVPPMHHESLTEPTVVSGEVAYHQSEDHGKKMPATVPVPVQDDQKVETHDPHIIKPKHNEPTLKREGPESAPKAAWPEDPNPKNLSSISQEESVAEKKDILVDINDRFPPDFLSEFFSKAKLAAAESFRSSFLKEEAGLSVNIQNHEPKRWSFFRNLAPDEFARKDVSLMDQDFNLGQIASQKKFDMDVKHPETSRRDVEDSAGIDVFHVNNDLFVNVGENIGLPPSEYDVSLF